MTGMSVSAVASPLSATREEMEKLKQFRSRVCKIYTATDEKMLSWLRARDLDVAKAEQMLRRHLIWRKNNEIQTLSGWKSPKCFFPYIHTGYDREGAPIYIMPIGRWEMRSSIESGDIVPALRFIYQSLENIISTANAQGIYQGVVICDFDGFGYRQIAHRTVLQGMLEVLRVFEANYPEVLKTAYVINAPKVFNYLFALVKPFLNTRTISKVQIYGENRSKWQEVLFNFMDSDQLPTYWGGSKKGSDEFCSDDWFMEPLPPNFLKKSASCYDEFGEEWITMKVPAGEKVIFQYNLKTEGGGGGLLKWSFYTEGYDIGFCVYYGQEKEDKFLVHNQRVQSHVEKEEGFLNLSTPGKYTVAFDNSYSRTRAKTLHYSLLFTDDLSKSNYQGDMEDDEEVFHDVIDTNSPISNGHKEDENDNELYSVKL